MTVNFHGHQISDELARQIARLEDKEARFEARLKRSKVGFEYDDGGRRAAGFKKRAGGDCVVRAIAIATETPYAEVHAEMKRRGCKDPDNGVFESVYGPYLEEAGWTVSSCRRLVIDSWGFGERVILETREHLVAMIDGIIRDAGDSRQDDEEPRMARANAIWTKYVD